ncbi:hypothetical protein RB195_012935 [Necator americanus]|uniref:Cation transporter family protein n=1 Tax=Necator americanus TaxID=51031 RepID=A0ABR1DUP8_NECAM
MFVEGQSLLDAFFPFDLWWILILFAGISNGKDVILQSSSFRQLEVAVTFTCIETDKSGAVLQRCVASSDRPPINHQVGRFPRRSVVVVLPRTSHTALTMPPRNRPISTVSTLNQTNPYAGRTSVLRFRSYQDSMYRRCRMLVSLLLFVNVCAAWDSSSTMPSVELTSVDYSTSSQDNSEIVVGSSKKLTEYLLSRHNMNAPPDGLLDLHYEMELVHILGIDELKQTMTVLVYVDEKWTDPSLSWDPALFGGILKTWIPVSKIWVPDIIIFNMLQREDLLSSVRAPALIYPNGTVEASHPAVYTVSCEINIKRFPLDDQRCALEIASWTYGKDKIRLHAHTEHSLEHYTDNEEWRLLKVSVIEDEYEHEGINVSELRYDVSVKRRPLFYMVTLTFPSYVMCAISVVGLFARFSTTGEREERFTLGVTAILTMAVLSLVVSEKVPHSSTHVPLLVAYFLFNMISVSVAAMTTGLVMKVHRMGRHGQEPEEWLLRLFCLRPVKIRNGIYTVADSPFHTPSYIKELSGELRKCESQPMAERIPVLESYIKKLASTCANIQGEIDDIDVDDPTAFRRRREANGYVRISERLDIIFMSFFLSLVTIPVVGFNPRINNFFLHPVPREKYNAAVFDFLLQNPQDLSYRSFRKELGKQQAFR